MEEVTKEEQEAINRVYAYAANMLVEQKKSAAETRSALMDQGLDEESASTIVNNLQSEISNAKKERAQKDMLFGALWCIGGIAITIFTYSAASGGGTYVVAWGAILFGAVQFFKGVFNSQP